MTCYCSLLKSVPLFADLNSGQLTEIEQACKSHLYPSEVALFHPQDAGGNLFIVMTGGVKISSGMSETDSMVTLVAEGESFGEMSLFTHKTQTSTAVTIADENKILVLNRKDFREALAKNPDLTEHLLFAFANRLEKQRESKSEFVSHSSLARVARLLLAKSNSENGALAPTLSQEEIAQYIGVRRETVARNLARLEESACLSRNRGRLVILDRSRLWRVAKSA